MKHLNKTCFIDLCPFILNLVYLFGHLNVLSGGFQGIKIGNFIQCIGHWGYQGSPHGSDGRVHLFTFIQCTETGTILNTVLGQSEDKD